MMYIHTNIFAYGVETDDLYKDIFPDVSARFYTRSFLKCGHYSGKPVEVNKKC